MQKLIEVKSTDGVVYFINPDQIVWVHSADSDPESHAVIMVATGLKVTTQEVPALVLDSIIKAMRA